MLLSIIIPVFNVEEYLPQCLDSVLHVYYAGIEDYGPNWMSLVCIDDGSTDSSLEILREFESQHNFAIVKSVPNGGAGYARNIGLQNASGDFIYFLDSDDYILPDAFLNVLNLLESDVDIVCGNAYYGDEGQLMKECSFSTNSGGEFCKKLYELTNIYYPCQLWVYFYRKAFLESNRIVFPKGIVCEDEEFTWTALSYARKVIKRQNIIVFHRQNRIGSVMNNISTKHIHSLIQVSRHLYTTSFLSGVEQWIRSGLSANVKILLFPAGDTGSTLWAPWLRVFSVRC